MFANVCTLVLVHLSVTPNKLLFLRLRTHHNIWGCRRPPCSGGGFCRRAVSSSLCASCARLEQTQNSNSWIHSSPTNPGMAPGAVVCLLCLLLLPELRGAQSEQPCAHQHLDPGGPGVGGQSTGAAALPLDVTAVSLPPGWELWGLAQLPLNTPSAGPAARAQPAAGIYRLQNPSALSAHEQHGRGDTEGSPAGVTSPVSPGLWLSLSTALPAELCFTRNAGRDTAPGTWLSSRDQTWFWISIFFTWTTCSISFWEHGQPPPEHRSHQGRVWHLPGGSSSLPAAALPRLRCAGDGRAALGCTGKPRSQCWWRETPNVGSGHKHRGEPAQMLPAPSTVHE